MHGFLPSHHQSCNLILFISRTKRLHRSLPITPISLSSLSITQLTIKSLIPLSSLSQYFALQNFLLKTMTSISSLLTDPLFSTIITLYILILLYFPALFLAIIFSPILISTSILLFSLLRLGAIQRTTQEEGQTEKNNPVSAEFSSIGGGDDGRKWVSSKSSESSEYESDSGFSNCPPSSFYVNSFVEWDVRAPLEVIYEEYEGQEDDEDDVLEEKRAAQMAVIERYASLAKFYPDTDDSDTSSEEEDFPVIRDWDPPESMCFRWEGEDRDGLIEIELEGKGYSDGEEENLIEIDLSPAR